MANYRNINVRSPFFTQKATTGSLVNCEIRLWKGDVVTDLPVDYTYLLTKEPTSGKSTFEVAELARDFLAHTTTLSSGFAWMELKLKDAIVADDTFTFLVSEGYSLSTEGLQSTNDTPLYDLVGLPVDDTPQGRRHIMVTESGTNIIPYFSNPLSNTQKTGAVSITAGLFSVVGVSTLFTTEFSVGSLVTIAGENFTVATITDDLNLTVNVAHVAGAFGVNIFTTYEDHYIDAYDLSNVGLGSTIISQETNSSQMVRNFIVTPSMSAVYFDFDGNGQNVIVDVLRCSKFDAVNLLYVNKFGFKTKFPFILKSTEKISVESDSFSRSTVDYGALTLNTNSHSSRKRIKDTKQSFVLNSDWIAEYYVSQFEELMLSEYVWLEKGSLTLPVNITTSKLDKKTHINDKLINYSIEVETASNYINTIR